MCSFSYYVVILIVYSFYSPSVSEVLTIGSFANLGNKTYSTLKKKKSDAIFYDLSIHETQLKKKKLFLLNLTLYYMYTFVGDRRLHG
jgi:hypothetical protein